ncbi:But2 domain containing protein [Pyrenophora tritici-repentis]|nr:uncharacterized protein PTRG_09077 [Pyrenophora tritici-repentis Pt-1C-BFP]KAF7442306.1 But2 multi-domain protein [Pyrenophora tritici-repentis]EDU42128.1 conserved hypothetical protein [Pyrenophora tritici-repentis Pt-1C-BFP]KAG9378245.1 But2 multi-domain protein [Pyrenophora tritici-repentis]KAI0571886.1 But2 multi-domain protein [Pyrenophora tritici-repentis]KAI1513186.1 Ubiquitin 3 binding protein But2 C-terminal domain containing protein [Pyrenophora tritici-repentis]
MLALALLSALFGLTVFAELIDIQFPHMLLPLKEAQPNIAFKTQPDATVSLNSQTGDEQWTAVNFDVPDHGNTHCHVNFHLNTNKLKSAPVGLKGQAPFAINISRIEPTLVNGGTTWNTKPATIEHVAIFILDKDLGTSEIFGKWFDCPKGVAQFIIHPAGARDLEAYWYELDYTMADGGPHGITLEMFA